VIDFTSSLYLGMRHPHASLAPWTSLTTGVPAALGSPPAARAVCAELARLQGCEGALLGTSTLHLFWDVCGMMNDDVALLADGGLYAVGRAGVERAKGRGVPVRVVPHYDAVALGRAAAECARQGRRPVLVCDGLCVDCGRIAPLARTVPLLEAHRGHAIVDDTQALGVVGTRRSARRSLGAGGGGSLRHQGVTASGVLVICSLAKAFGVPVAALSGRHAMLARYAARSEVRVHSSPPSLAHVAAATRALGLNRLCGERLRERLRAATLGFRRRAARSGVALGRTLLPVQTVEARVDGVALHRALLRCGITTVLRARDGHGRPGVSFVITARHTAVQIEEAVDHLARALSVLTTATTHKDDDDVDHTRWLHRDHAALPGAAPPSPLAAAH
jgi:8-amino-7-oxononanoate synthase